jgi:hypothetical protein
MMKKGRVAPKALLKKQQSTRSAFQIPNNRTKHYEVGISNRKRRKDLELYANKSTYIFTLLLGLTLIIGGSAMTWWGTQSEVKDLLIIGPGTLCIGFLFVVVGIVFGVRAMYYRQQVKKFNYNETTGGHVASEYYMPNAESQNAVPETETPGGNILYGADDLARARRASMVTHQATTRSNQVVTPPTPVHVEGVNPHCAQFYVEHPSELAAPIVSFPKNIVDVDHGGSTYKVVMDLQSKKDKHKDTLPTIKDDEDGGSENKEMEDVDNDQLKTRPDSGIFPGTPDTLDTVLTNEA